MGLFSKQVMLNAFVKNRIFTLTNKGINGNSVGRAPRKENFKSGLQRNTSR